MYSPDTQYEALLAHVLQTGAPRGDRTGTGTRSVFGAQLRYELSSGFPLITTKKIHAKSVVHELLWMLRGETNIRYLKENGVRIWDEWADENSDLGPIYGAQWRSWRGADGKVIDQIANVVEEIRTNPSSRRLVVSAWNVGQLEEMALPPCHALFQFYVANGRLSCQLYQRSADLFLGVPFNIASYSLLTHMVAQQCDLAVGEFIWTGGDCHIYDNHVEQVTEQIHRPAYGFPTLKLNKAPSIFEYRYEDVEFLNYQHHPAIKAPVAV